VRTPRDLAPSTLRADGRVYYPTDGAKEPDEPEQPEQVEQHADPAPDPDQIAGVEQEALKLGCARETIETHRVDRGDSEGDEAQVGYWVGTPLPGRTKGEPNGTALYPAQTDRCDAAEQPVERLEHVGLSQPDGAESDRASDHEEGIARDHDRSHRRRSRDDREVL